VMPRVDGDVAALLSRHPAWHWIVPIPSALKQEIRDRLLVMNISERTMYPGLEGTAKWHRAYYGGRSPLLPSRAMCNRHPRRRE
jgi:hypothetical protein